MNPTEPKKQKSAKCCYQTLFAIGLISIGSLVFGYYLGAVHSKEVQHWVDSMHHRLAAIAGLDLNFSSTEQKRVLNKSRERQSPAASELIDRVRTWRMMLSFELELMRKEENEQQILLRLMSSRGLSDKDMGFKQLLDKQANLATMKETKQSLLKQAITMENHLLEYLSEQQLSVVRTGDDPALVAQYRKFIENN